MGSAPQPRNKAEGEYFLRYKKWDIVADAVHLIIPWGSFIAIFVLLYLMVDRLAGKMTLADIGMSVKADVKVSDVVAYIFGGCGTLYGYKERRLRHKKTEELAAYASQLEASIDPNRTSSKLTKKGTTRPGDNRL